MDAGGERCFTPDPIFINMQSMLNKCMRKENHTQEWEIEQATQFKIYRWKKPTKMRR